MGVKLELLVVLALVGVCLGQRSPYAPRPVGLLDPLPQYTSATADLDNRFGEVITTPAGPSLPGSLHDQETINRVASWPKEKQPFWFVNNQQLSGHRGVASTADTTASTTTRSTTTRSTATPVSDRVQQRFGSSQQPQELPRLFRPAQPQDRPAFGQRRFFYR